MGGLIPAVPPPQDRAAHRPWLALSSGRWLLAARTAGGFPWALPTLQEGLLKAFASPRAPRDAAKLLLVCLYHSWINRVSSRERLSWGAPGSSGMEMRQAPMGHPGSRATLHTQGRGGWVAPPQEGLCVHRKQPTLTWGISGDSQDPTTPAHLSPLHAPSFSSSRPNCLLEPGASPYLHLREAQKGLLKETLLGKRCCAPVRALRAAQWEIPAPSLQRSDGAKEECSSANTGAKPDGHSLSGLIFQHRPHTLLRAPSPLCPQRPSSGPLSQNPDASSSAACTFPGTSKRAPGTQGQWARPTGGWAERAGTQTTHASGTTSHLPSPPGLRAWEFTGQPRKTAEGALEAAAWSQATGAKGRVDQCVV